jgi:hypothetical protein
MTRAFLKEFLSLIGRNSVADAWRIAGWQVRRTVQ